MRSGAVEKVLCSGSLPPLSTQEVFTELHVPETSLFPRKLKLTEPNWKAQMVLLSGFHPISSIMLTLSGIITLNMISKKIGGLAFREDHFNPGYFESRLKMGTSYFFIAASTENISSLTLEKAEELYTREVYRQNLFAFNSRLTEPFALKLLRATDPFIVKHPLTGEKTIIAGYPWFSDWGGRDVMISFPGLF